MTAPPGSAEELDEDAGREEGLPTPGGEWDEGEQGAGTRRERRARGGEWSGGKSKGQPRAPRCRDCNHGGSNRDTGVGVAGEGNRGDHTVRKEWGEKVDPAFDQWAFGDIHDRVVESGSDRNQERL